MTDQAAAAQRPTAPDAQPSGPLLLVGYDQSQSSRRALDYAVRLAGERGGRLVVVSVHNTLLVAIAPELMPDVTSANVEIDTEVRAELVERLGDTVPWELVCLEGNPFLLLTEHAEALGAEAIVLGGSRRSGLHLTGSLAVNLVKKARWPVIVVP